MSRAIQPKLALVAITVLLLLTHSLPSTAQGTPPATPQSPFADRHSLDIPFQYPRVPGEKLAPVSANFPAVSGWSKLTFASYRNLNDFEIYKANGDGSGQTQLTFDGNSDSTPNLNRGATQVAFVSDRDGNVEIYKVNTDGSGLTRLTFNDAGDYWPVWSPDGSHIAFYSYRDGDTNAEIYVMNADGSNPIRLTFTDARDRYPNWSPDGTKIVFVTTRRGPPEIWTMNADGSNQQVLTGCNNYCFSPSWSPDGTHLAFADDANNDEFDDLALINSDGSGRTYLGYSSGLTDYGYPVWAPDGQNIAYAKISWTIIDGYYYWVDAYINGIDVNTRSIYNLIGAGFDWYPDWKTTDAAAPASQVTALPQWSGSDLTIQWSGSDSGGAGLKSYDVQLRDGLSGAWTDWQLATSQTSATFTGSSGHTYYFRARARDNAFNLEAYPGGDGDTFTGIDFTAPTSSAASPAFATEPGFVVSWSGDDKESGVATYDVQYRDSLTSTWTAWLTSTAKTSGLFTSALGHTDYFQSRAIDNAGNAEAYPGNNGDTSTTTPGYALTGQVLNTQDQPLLFAAAQTTAPALNAPATDYNGAFTLYYNLTGTYTLTASHADYGALPPMPNLQVTSVTTAPTVYLPPLNDLIADGGFESGDFSTWSRAGDVTPVVTATSHTGNFAAQLGGALPAIVVTPTTPFTATADVSQTLGTLTASFLTALIDPAAVTTMTTFTVTGVPTLTGLLTDTQDLGQHFSLVAVLSDGTSLTATVSPITITLAYSDSVWQAAQVAGENTLAVWRFDDLAQQWQPLTTTLDTTNNLVTVTTTNLGLFALLGTPDLGPWRSAIEQTLTLNAPLTSSTLSLLYQVESATPGDDALRLTLTDPTQTLTYTLPLTVTGWAHGWWQLPDGISPTLTVRAELIQSQRTSTTSVVLDEFSLGTAKTNAHRVYLPFLANNTQLPFP